MKQKKLNINATYVSYVNTSTTCLQLEAKRCVGGCDVLLRLAGIATCLHNFSHNKIHCLVVSCGTCC